MQPFASFSTEAYLNVASAVRALVTGQVVPLSRRTLFLSLYNVQGHLTDQVLMTVGNSAPVVEVLHSVALPEIADVEKFFVTAAGNSPTVQNALTVPAWAMPFIMQLIQKLLEGLIKTQ